jgi:hypothetical protein
MKTHRPIVVAAMAALAVVFLLATAGQAQDDPPPTPRLLGPEREADGGDRTISHQPIIAPVGGEETPAEPAPPMPRFGTSLVRMPVRLVTTPEGTSARLLEDPPVHVPEILPLLPSPLRQAMEDTEADDPLFIVSGRVTVFRGQCYLLPTRALLVEQPAQAAPARIEGDAGGDEVQAGDGDEASEADVSDDDGQVEADDIMSRLLDKARVRPVVPTRTDEGTEPASPHSKQAPSASAIDTEATGGIVVNRFVYVLQEPRTGWYQARFRSDNTLRKEPIRLLPNRLLQRVAPAPEALRVGAYQVSGDVLVYRGRRYLLLRKAIAKRDLNL